MATDIEYALMAGASYVTNRKPENQFPIPQGWDALEDFQQKADPNTGFEAAAFKKGDEIVISFAGTHGDISKIFSSVLA